VKFVLALALAAVACRSGQGTPGRGLPQPEPLADNCGAPLPFAVEVARLLTMAAAHATRSAACVDGPGMRVTVDEVLICPQDRGQREIVLVASYRVGRHQEGDTRGCGDCSWTKPRFSMHQTHVRFRRTTERGPFRMDVPAGLPGIPNMTPLDQKHEGDCYGSIGPFVPEDLALP
jgi:hypothetical protein